MSEKVKQKLTIDELEAILNKEEDYRIKLLPDGSIIRLSDEEIDVIRKEIKEEERKADEVRRLADELFRAVEKSQGFAFISDGEGAGMTKQQFFERIRGRLDWSHKATEEIKKFLKKYQQLS